jgi:hypothetical protein
MVVGDKGRRDRATDIFNLSCNRAHERLGDMATSRPHFEVNVEIQELTNIPQSIGLVSVRWYIKDSPRSETRGRTKSMPIKNHRVAWNHHLTTKTRMGIDRHNVLRHAYMVFEVVWEHSGNNKLNMGKVELNLSEYVGREPVVTRYLLKESKVNSILNLIVTMKQTKGTIDYAVPPFSTPQIFGDITGVMDEQKVRYDRDHEHFNMLSKLYHQTFAISWDPLPGELDPEACIEDIFSGGDGFGLSDEWEIPISPHSEKTSSTGENSKRISNESGTNYQKRIPTTTTTRNHKTKRDDGSDSQKNANGDLASEPDSSQSSISSRLLREDEERDNFKSWRI